MSKRLEVLEKMTAAGGEPFAWYALAMEYRKERRLEDSLRAFETLRSRAPDYLPLYLMAGQLLVEAGRAPEARAWLERGIALAASKADAKAQSELEAALAEL